MSQNENKVGPQLLGDGAISVARMSRTGGQVAANEHPLYWEASSRGNVYVATNQSGVTTQAGLSATTPALTLYNPAGNNKNAVLIYAGCTASVAFAAASVIWLGANTNIAAAAVTGSAATVRSALLGNAASPSCSALVTATLPAAPVAVSILGVGLTGAITTIPSLPTYGRFFDGSLVLYPGSAISFQTSTASGASGFFGELIWEEVAL